MQSRVLNSITGKGQLNDKDRLIKWEEAGGMENRRGEGRAGDTSRWMRSRERVFYSLSNLFINSTTAYLE